MKNPIALGLSVLAISGAAASGATLTFTAFDTVSGGVFDELPDASCCVLSEGTQTNVTHLLVGPLSCYYSSDDVYYLGGGYTMAQSGVSGDVASGAMVFALDSDEVDNSYPVVGIIPLSGGWSNASITVSGSDGALDGQSATVVADQAASVVEMTVGSSDVLSCLPYVVRNDSSLTFEAPFWITGDSVTKFTFGYLESQNDGSYTGIVMTDLSGDLADGVYKITLTGTTDSDSDGVADIMDADNYWYADCDYDSDTGLVSTDWLGDFYFYYPSRNSDTLDSYESTSHAFLWHPYHGWLYGVNYVDGNSAKWTYFYDFNMGWVVTNASIYPYLYAYDATIDSTAYGANWLYYYEGGSDGSPRYFYALSGGTMHSSSNIDATSMPGWWEVEGAN